MTDYGHDLLFGTFVTPRRRTPATRSSSPSRPTVPDSTSSPSRTTRTRRRFLDTSTLLAYVAARTEHVHVSANVSSLPLRPPAVLARAAASLDIGSAAAASNSASAPAPSGTASPRWAAAS